MGGTVIIGAGHAGIELADALRTRDPHRPITILDAERDLPYQRPPLSKDYLADTESQPLPLRGSDFYGQRHIDLRRGTEVTAIDRHAQTLALADGSHLDYDDLVIATGSANRRLTVPGADLPGVYYLRTTDDAHQLRDALATTRRAVVIGAGFIGLEFAAMARKHDIDVTVLEYGPRALMRALSPTTSDHVVNTHRANGIGVEFGAQVTEITQHGDTLAGVRTEDGRYFDADLVVVGIGATARTDLATRAGVSVERGVVVDEFLRTDDPHIWAIGDCATYHCTHAAQRVRRESVQNAVDQARALAATLTGTPTAYQDVPWFWSHQGACKIQIAGPGGALDQTVVRGDMATGKFSVLCFREHWLVSVESVNQPAVHLAARRAMAGAPITDAELAAADYDLKALTAATPV
ncbi:FAD-dependent oxidoreductase [Gordonia sp. CPCC 205515]|uniref:NAD(P)/FAD-dependent oxidoreductase n=1 Tax=Gordonia sp. CPCC 205515 TaxID=3140791 RepID=UPI003AF3AF25